MIASTEQLKKSFSGDLYTRLRRCAQAGSEAHHLCLPLRHEDSVNIVAALS